MEIEAKRKALVSRLKRVEGQVRGLQRLLENDEDCEKVAQQMAAARKALDKAFFQTLSCAMERELEESRDETLQQQQQRIQKIAELMAKYG